MSRYRGTLAWLLLSGLVAATAHAAMQSAATSATTGAAAASGNQEMEEVVVRGTRLSELRSQIIAAENRFYVRYNEINQVRDFRIDCIMDAPTGQKKKVRRCRTGLEVRARTEEGRDVLERLQQHAALLKVGSENARSDRGTSIDIMSEYAKREEQFRQHFLQVVNAHADLRALLDEREARQAAYDRELARRSSGRLVTW